MKRKGKIKEIPVPEQQCRICLEVLLVTRFKWMETAQRFSKACLQCLEEES